MMGFRGIVQGQWKMQRRREASSGFGMRPARGTVQQGLGFIVVLLMISGASASWAAAPQRVLLLHSFGNDFAPYSVVAGDFRTDLAKMSPSRIEFYDVSLESSRYVEGDKDRQFLDYMHALFDARPPDLVLPLGGPAVRFLQRNRQQLFPHVPTILAAVDERHLKSSAFTDMDATVPVHIDTVQVIGTILQVLPKTTDIYVVLGASPLE